MTVNEQNIAVKIAEKAVEAGPEVKEMLNEGTQIHAVLALSLADVYGNEAKRLKAKYGADDARVANAQLKKNIVMESAKDIAKTLVIKKATAGSNPGKIAMAAEEKHAKAKTPPKASKPAAKRPAKKRGGK